MERRLVAGLELTWEPPDPERLAAAGASWAVRVHPLGYPDVGRATAAAVQAHRAEHPSARVLDVAELDIGGRRTSRVLMHTPEPDGPECLEEWRVDAAGRLVLLRARCPVAAYDGLADAFAAAAGSLCVVT